MVNSNEVRPEEEIVTNEPTIEPIEAIEATEAANPDSPKQASPSEFEAVATSVLTQQAPSTTTELKWRNVSIHGQKKGSSAGRMGLRAKATLAALALSVLPTVTVGGAAYTVASHKFESQIRNTEQARAEELADKVNRYIFERFADIQDFSSLPTFTDATVRNTLSFEDKDRLLAKLQKDTKAYDSIAVFSLDGEAIAKSDAKPLENHANRDYFKTVLRTGKPFISEPTLSATTQKQSVFFAAPIRDRETREVIAIMRSRMPIEKLAPLVEPFNVNGEKHHLADRSHVFFKTASAEEVGKTIESTFPDFSDSIERKEAGSMFSLNQTLDKRELVTYAPFGSLEGLPDLNWSAVLSVDETVVLAPKQQLLLILGLGTVVASVIAGLISTLVISPSLTLLLDASKAIKKLGEGELDVALDVPKEGDEFVQLGNSINTVGEQLKQFLLLQQMDSGLNSLLSDLAQVRSEEELSLKLEMFVYTVQQRIESDRVIFQRILDADGSGPVLAEAVLSEFTDIQGQSTIALSEHERSLYAEQQTLMLTTLTEIELSAEQLQQLQSWQVRSQLSTPVFVNNQLYGLLTVHSCSQDKIWDADDRHLIEQFGRRLGLSLNGFDAFQQAEARAQEESQKQQALQMELLNLLGDVEGASSGDLTVRAQITDGEIGIVADFFNAIVENLRDIVTQVKTAATQVNDSVNQNDQSIRQLADKSMTQAEQVLQTLASVEVMTHSLQSVATKAQQAARASQQASRTAQAGQKAMETTVDSIFQVRETVAETAKKVKRLGEASQHISKVIELINQIALKTNLLAVNAGIEAARAGEEGRGFAVVAEEVGALAAQSSTATQEIEQIIEAIQQGTSEVVEAMETSTSQVVEGTRSVETAKKSLAQILKVSRQVNQVFQAISTETSNQVETSEVVKQLMDQMAAVSKEAADASQEVSHNLQETAEITQQLQTSMGAFKVEEG